MPKISIIIPVYNTEQYLRQCLDSIINQTFTDFECICVNDGSTDNSLSILQEYANRDNRIKIINQQNKGVAVTRNVLLKNSSGKYVAFVDCDDWIAQNYLEILYNTIEKLHYDIVLCNHYRYYSKDNEFVRYVPDIVINKKTASFDKFICGYNFGAVWARLYRREFLENNKIFFLENVIMEDYLFSIITYLSTIKIAQINDTLYYYRKQITSIMSDTDNVTVSKFYNNIYLIKEIIKRQIGCPQIYNFLVKNFFHNFSDTCKRVKKSGYGMEIFFNKSSDALHFFYTIKKDLYLKYKIAIPVSIGLLSVLKTKIFIFRNLFKIIH